MNKSSNKNIQNDFDDDEIFDDSALLANFNNSSFKEISFTDRNANKSSLNISALCCDEEISGYDRLTGETWIYPTNYPVRDYQFNIIRAAMLKNTLVSLPTGLGKTFIAAVLMYNFYRWYPLGKIVFTAPTRPLVAQQIEACYNIVALPPKDTIEMTGHMQVSTRKLHWQSKRVFFATPQVIYNDIKSGICPGDKLRCLVIDEAHRARGNYAYCQIVATLTDMGHKTYRVLALSATPGSKVEDVINVVKHLNIAHLELRTENCIDVAPYSHSRKINTVIIQLGSELTQLRERYVEILDCYARRLKQFNILPQNLGNLSKGRVVMLYKEFQTKDRGARHPQHNIIMKDFTLLIALYHGLELLVKHGSRVFLNFFDEHPEKSWIQSDDNLTALLERLRDDLGTNPLSLDRSILPDGTVPEIPLNLRFGHPKFDKLKEIMLNHFERAKKNQQDTRAIVFCEYRESVSLVHCLLLQCRPLIAPQMFVGQGASGKDGKTVTSQKQQLRVMKSFREGACNALVCTCVAEEGLDVGSVDLILCFDISTRSPVRLVQRCGRTGRERGGQVFILVTEGREHQTLIDCMRQRDGLNTRILQSKEVENSLYRANPRMVPHDFTPRCQKMHITVADKGVGPNQHTKKGQKNIKSMLHRASTSNAGTNSARGTETTELISEEDFNREFPNGFEVAERIGPSREVWCKNREAILEFSKEESNYLKLHTWLEWQRSLQKTINIGHSVDSEILTSLLKCGDDKRFDAPPSTENPTFNTQDFATQNIVKTASSQTNNKPPKKKAKVPFVKSPTKRDGDIRALFSTATKSTKNYTKLINDLGIQNDGRVPIKLINLLVDLNIEITNNDNKCFICSNICDCKYMKKIKEKSCSPILFLSSTSLKLPDLDLIDDIDTDAILKCAKNKTKDLSPEPIDMKNISVGDQSKNFDLEFDFDLSNSPVLEKETVVSEKLDTNFDIGDIEDIFEKSSPEESNEIEKAENPKDTLGFFGLDSIDDIFADSDDEPTTSVKEIDRTKNSCDVKEVDAIEIASDDEVIQCNKLEPKITSNADYNPKSPSILSGRVKTDTIPTSPILCSQPRKFQLSTKKKQLESSTPMSHAKKKLMLEPVETDSTQLRAENSNISKSNSKHIAAETGDKSMFTITQLVEMINSSNNHLSIRKTNLETKSRNTVDNQSLVNERSSSPILLTQAERNKSCINKTNASQTTKRESLIILDSDSDSNDDTQEYNLTSFKDSLALRQDSSPILSCKEPALIRNACNESRSDREQQTSKLINDVQTSPQRVKRKLEDDDEIVASPYFGKKRKTDTTTTKPLTLREKVLAALSSNKLDINTDDDVNVNFLLHSPKFVSQKENKDPTFKSKSNLSEDDKPVNSLESLQKFRKDSKQTPRKINFVDSPKRSKCTNADLTFEDSDDDFVGTDRNLTSQKRIRSNITKTPKSKVRKKKSAAEEFLDLEAEVSSDADSESGSDSADSLRSFLCDENVDNGDIAHYLQSVKSPVKGVFKIPELPKKFNKEEIFSQFVDEDSYEMDSFCVDSHIGLTQVNDISELELAEMRLEEKRRKRKAPKNNTTFNTTESPVVRRTNKKARRIDSDSDDSS